MSQDSAVQPGAAQGQLAGWGGDGGGGPHLIVCSSCRDSWLRATPLVSAMNTAFPEASWAWRNGIWIQRQKVVPSGFVFCRDLSAWPWGHPCPHAQVLHTHPFADQVIGEVGGQHVRTECLCHVLTVNLGAPANVSWGMVWSLPSHVLSN